MFFMELISVGYENTKYLINRFVLQEVGRFDYEELVGEVNHTIECVTDFF